MERQRKAAVTEKLCVGTIIKQRRKSYPAAGEGGPQSSKKLSHNAKNTLFQILIHCETIRYPYTLPKTLS